MKTQPNNTCQRATGEAAFAAVLFRCWMFALAAVALLVTTGCSSSKNEEDGDDEPKTGFYRMKIFGSPEGNVQVSRYPITSPSISVFPTPQLSTLRVRWSLEVTCFGVQEFLPPNCDANMPDWDATFTVEGKLKRGGSFARIEFGDRSLAKTEATLIVDVDQLRNSIDPNDNSTVVMPGIITVQIRFFPRRIPPDLSLSGDQFVYVQLHFPNPVPREQEKPADEATLRIFPTSQHFQISGANLKVPSHRPNLVYNGPDTTISEIVLSGSGASKFTVLGPAKGTALMNGTRIPIDVDFNTLDSVSTAEAAITISTANGKHNGVTLTGKRDS